MPEPAKPAPKTVDDRLFRDAPKEVRDLNARARKELRQARRVAYSKLLRPKDL